LGWFKRRIPGCLVDGWGFARFSRGGHGAPFLCQQSSVETPTDVFAMAARIACRTKSLMFVPLADASACQHSISSVVVLRLNCRRSMLLWVAISWVYTAAPL